MRVLLILSSFILAFVSARSAADWKSRVVYQLLTDRYAQTQDSFQNCNNLWGYCGGTWTGIKNHLDYIKELGADAIWISPILLNIEGAYHGYAAKDLYKLNPHFGTEAELHALITACHNKDIWVMFDVVANHVGNTKEDFSQITPFDKGTYYHRRCQINNWQNQTEVEICRLADLPDLDQSIPFVRDTLYDWVKNLVATYQIDGIRIDTVPEVAKQFWPGFVKAAGVYSLGEVFDGRIDYVAGYQNVMDGLLSYPLYFTLRNVFQNHASMYGISTVLQAYQKNFRDTTVLGNFIDNHDNPRFLHDQEDQTLYKNALAITLLGEGIPLLYYGSEQGFAGGADPGCREPLWITRYSTSHDLFKFIKAVLGHRKAAKTWNTPHTERYVDDQFYAFTRGTTLVLTTNVGSNGGDIYRTITYHPYTDGTKLCNLFWPQDCIFVKNGKIDITLLHGETKVFSPK